MPLAPWIHGVFRKPILPVVFFFGGVSFDAITLTRIDRLSDNLILLTYLGILGVLIVLMGRIDSAPNSTTPSIAPSLPGRVETRPVPVATSSPLHPPISPARPEAAETASFPAAPARPEAAETASFPAAPALPEFAKTDSSSHGLEYSTPSNGGQGVPRTNSSATGQAPFSREASPMPPVASFVARTRGYYPMAIQFLFGGLFSAYAVFYSRSASLTSTALFFVVLVGLLIGNEFLRDRVSNLKLMLALYALAACSFLTFFLPVITGRMSTPLFLIGAALSAVLPLQWRVSCIGETSSIHPENRYVPHYPPFSWWARSVVFYFLNWIPPVPLSMSFGGMYHKVVRSGDAYELTLENPPWYNFWKRSDDPFHGLEGANCFTAIFAPIDLHAQIYHHWQHRQGEAGRAGRFVTTDRIRLAIVGGRKGGYRAFTVKQSVAPGDWRVDVETAEGRIIGRVSFRVEVPTHPLTFKTIIY